MKTAGNSYLSVDEEWCDFIYDIRLTTLNPN